MSLTEALWADSNAFSRRRLLDGVADRTTGCAAFSFGVYSVTLDFDAGTATVIDLVSTENSETMSLTDFLARAASYADDPSIGDRFQLILAPEYSAPSMLWSKRGPVRMSSLPLPDNLRQAMDEWYSDWIGETNIYTTEQNFMERGHELARLIQEALGPRYFVIYDD